MAPSPNPLPSRPFMGVIDVDALLSGLARVLPPRKSGLLTPFVETVLLIERLTVAGFAIEVERRVYTRAAQEYIIAQGVRLGDDLFNARSRDPWGDIEQWNSSRSDKRLRWLVDDPLTNEEVAETMANAESVYAGYRGVVDWAIAQARAEGEGRQLEENTPATAGQGVVVRL